MLRDYQEKSIDEIEQLWDDGGNRCMLQMPTGAGKTYVFCEIAKRYFTSETKKVLIIVHRKELLEQAYKALGERCFKIEAGLRTIPTTFDYYVGMVETINRRMGRMPDIGLVIIDEAHIANFNKLPYFEYEDVRILGVSATPTSATTTPLSEKYKTLLIPTNISHLIKNNYLVDCDSYAFADDEIKKADFKTDRSGDFNLRQMGDFYENYNMIETVIEKYWELVKGKQTMVFNTTIEHNNKVYFEFKKEGLNAYRVDSSMSKLERDSIISKFKADPHGIMNNVGILTTGFDCPSVEAIILNRATKSLTLYLQMIGRGARISPGKEKFILLDMGGNVLRHGFYSSYFDWQYYFKQKKEEHNGVAPTKLCPQCGYVLYASVMVCPGCGYEFPKKDQRERLKEEMKLLLDTDPLRININLLFSIGNKRGWNAYAYLYRIADHVVNYKNRHKDIVNDEMLDMIAEPYFDDWCKRMGKMRTQWNRDFFKNAIETVKKERKKD